MLLKHETLKPAQEELNTNAVLHHVQDKCALTSLLSAIIMQTHTLKETLKKSRQ